MFYLLLTGKLTSVSWFQLKMNFSTEKIVDWKNRMREFCFQYLKKRLSKTSVRGKVEQILQIDEILPEMRKLLQLITSRTMIV